MILDSSRKLEGVLSAAVAANQPEFHVDYLIHNTAGGVTPPQPASGALNSTTDVTLLAAPSTDAFYFEVTSVSIYNKDTAAVTVTVKTDDGTERIICKATLQTGESLHYGRGIWYALTASGATKNDSISYQTGTFTPTLIGSSTAGSQTYVTQVGRYVKVGQMVHVHGYVEISAKDGTMAGNTQVGGLPFTAENVTSLVSPAALSNASGFTYAAGRTFLCGEINPNTALISLRCGGDGATSPAITVANTAASSSISFSCAYRAAS